MNKEQDTTYSNAGISELGNFIKAGFVLLYALAILLVLYLLIQSFFIVKEHEAGIIFRFGNVRSIVSNGLHLTWPYPIEERARIDISRARKVSTSAFTPKDKNATVLRPDVDGYLLTADQNIIHAECSLTYYINPDKQSTLITYFLETKNKDYAENTIRTQMGNALIKASSELNADEVLFRMDTLRSRVAKHLRSSLNQINLFINFDSKDISITTYPPYQTKKAFDALVRTGQDQDRLINEATSYKTRITKEAQSKAEAIVAAAETYKIKKTAEASADARTFVERLKQYQKEPLLIRKTIYEEALTRILENVDEKFLINSDQEQELRIFLSRRMDKPEVK